MAQARVDHRPRRIDTHPAAAHLVGGEDGDPVGAERRLIDLRQIALPRDPHRLGVEADDLPRTVGEMDAGDGLHAGPEALVDPLGEGVVEPGTAPAARRHRPTVLARVEAVDHQRDGGGDVRQQGHVRPEPRAEAGHGDGGEHRVHRRGLDEEAGPFAAPREVVGCDALGSAVEAFDSLLVEGAHRDHRMQPGLLADRALIEARAEQQDRRIDRAARDDHDPGLDP